jgi:hypothetical protein
MRSLRGVIRRAILATVLVLSFGFSTIAYADNDTGGVGTDAAAMDAAAVSDPDATTGEEGDPSQTILEEEPPLSTGPYRVGWSVVNLLISLTTTAIGVLLAASFMVQKKNGDLLPNGFGLTVFSMIAAIISIILFVSTENLQLSMIAANSFTVAHIAVLSVSVLCVALTVKKEGRHIIRQGKHSVSGDHSTIIR